MRRTLRELIEQTSTSTNRIMLLRQVKEPVVINFNELESIKEEQR